MSSIHPSIYPSIHPSIHLYAVFTLWTWLVKAKTSMIMLLVVLLPVAIESFSLTLEDLLRADCAHAVSLIQGQLDVIESLQCACRSSTPPPIDCHYPLLAGQDCPQSQGLSWSTIWPLCNWWYCVPSSGEIYNADVHICYMYCILGVVGGVSAL